MCSQVAAEDRNSKKLEVVMAFLSIGGQNAAL